MNEKGKVSGKTSQSIIDRLKPIGELRDVVLVMAGIFYLFGYIVWAINAYNNKLGLVPALDFQYVVAGIVPVLIVGTIISIMLAYKRLRKKLKAWFDPDEPIKNPRLRNTVVILWFISLVFLFISFTDRFQAVFSDPVARPWLRLLPFVPFTVLSLLLPPVEKTGDRSEQSLISLIRTIAFPFHYLGKLYAYSFVLIFFPLLAFLFFVETMYSRIPQEFGGARPRYACLDLVKGQLAGETIAVLTPLGKTSTNDTVARSLRLEVLFSSNEILVVRSQGKVYEITKSAIQAVSTCD